MGSRAHGTTASMRKCFVRRSNPLYQTVLGLLQEVGWRCIPIIFVVSVALIADPVRAAFDPGFHAQLLAKQGKPVEAETIYTQLLKKDPQNCRVRIALGSLHLDNGKSVEAKNEIETAITQLTRLGAVIPRVGFSSANDLLLSDAYFKLAGCHYKLNNYDECIEITSKLLANTPDCDTYYLRASSYHRTNQLEKSEKDLNDGIAYDASQGRKPEERFFHERALVLSDEGRTSEALADYDKALDIEACARAYTERAMIYKSLKNLTKCRADLDAAIKSDPSMESAYHERALLSMDEGKNTEALADLALAEKFDPTCAAIKEDRNIIEMEMKKYVQIH